MQEDMIDWLIIDEASQVSIAESLSLMLRAKQTIVFGDELQYGAVGATNVSLEYSKQTSGMFLMTMSKTKMILFQRKKEKELLLMNQKL